MGNKISATGFRIGVSKDWDSKWYANDKNFGKSVIEDLKIRKFFDERLFNAGLERVIIERSVNDITITIKTSRPGVVIGRKGAGVNVLKEDLSKMVGSKVSISVEEVQKPETSARLIAVGVAEQIQRRIHYRRAVQTAISKARDQGVSGIKIIVSGVLSGANSISRTETYGEGSVPQTTLKANIDFAEKQAITGYGVIGIKVWVYKKEN